MYLVLIETSGNQNYIFSTNRLRENIGASELTYQAGTYWVGHAVAHQNSQNLFENCQTPAEFRAALRNQLALEKTDQKAEIIVAASGKALILTKDEETARKIISEVTRRALIQAPGLDIAGVYEAIPETQNFANEKTLGKVINKVHQMFEKMRSRRPSPENRFLRLPIVASCAVSGLPASTIDTLGRKPKLISQVSATKRDKAKDAKTRLTHLDQRLQAQIDQLLKPDAEDQEEKRSWLAVVHADGNGLGQIFLNFEDYLGKDKSNRNYINQYREFSLSLDECTEAAFKAALDVFPEESSPKREKVAAIVPLIIGGDDLTVVCDGHYALEFTRVFLQKFEEQTETKAVISEIAQKAFDVNRLSACAGVAIVKRHFPFSIAYQLAEELIKSAKEVKRKVTKKGDPKTPFPCSAIDFHILYDTSGANLGDIRRKLEPESTTRLYNRPLVVTTPAEQLIENQSPDNEDIGVTWLNHRYWPDFLEWVELVKNTNLFPSSQSHSLRTTLHLGVAAAKAEYQLIQNRYPELKNFLDKAHQACLFHEEKIKDKDEIVRNYQITPFLDALDAKDFLKNNQTETSQE